MFCKHYILYFFTALIFMSCQGNNKVVEFSETEYTDSVLLAPNNPKESPVCQSSIKLILLPLHHRRDVAQHTWGKS